MSIRFAILGPGKIADRFLAPAINQVPGAELWSVLSRDKERAEEFAKRHQAKSPRAAYTEIDPLLADPQLDAVIIATPDGLHAEQTLKAARAKKHIFSEKPMTTNLADGEMMIKECQAAGVQLGIAYHLRWHQGHRALAAKVHQKELGQPRHMRVQWTFQAPDNSNWRAKPPLGRWWGLAGVGTHALDLCRWMLMPLCGEIVTVKSLISRSVHKGPNDETALVMLQFESGATAEIVTSVLFSSTTSVEIYGSQGNAICRDTLGPHGKGEITCLEKPLSFTPKDPYQGEIADFIDAIHKKRHPEVGGKEGVRNIEILLQADPRTRTES